MLVGAGNFGLSNESGDDYRGVLGEIPTLLTKHLLVIELRGKKFRREEKMD